MSGMTESNAGTLMERLRLAQNQTVVECVSNCNSNNFSCAQNCGYQEHALRNVQPRQRRAKTNATDSNSRCVSEIVRAARR
jgi:hypothetical protein